MNITAKAALGEDFSPCIAIYISITKTAPNTLGASVWEFLFGYEHF
jgi:hypothetical protein